MGRHPQRFSRMQSCQRYWNSAVISLVFCLSLHACICVVQISALSIDGHSGLRLDLQSSGPVSAQRSMQGPDSVKKSNFTSWKHLVVRIGTVVSKVISLVVFETLAFLYCYHKKSFGATAPAKEGAGKTLSNPKLPNFSFADANVIGSAGSEFPKNSTSSTSKLVPKKAWESRGIRKGVEQSAGSADITGPSGPLLSTDTVSVQRSDLKQANCNFTNLSGEGGFGPVYFGRLPSTQIEVAVKVQANESLQGARAFSTEVDTLFRAKHPNLVRLIGYKGEKGAYILGYEVMGGGTLQDRLYGLKLKFLCSDCIPSNVHRDIKTANILLMITKSGDAKLIDFGLSKFLNVEVLSKFRNVLLELVSGREPRDSDLLLIRKIAPWIRSQIRPGDLDTVSKALRGEFTKIPMTRRVAELAMSSAELHSIRRPTISQVAFEHESSLKEAQTNDTPPSAEKHATMGLQAELLELLSKSRTRSLIGDGAAGTPGQTRSKRGSKVRRLTPKIKSVVVPATRTDHPPWLPLTNLDRVVNPTFVSVIFVYENVLTDKGYGKTFEDVTTSLKDSLAKALVDFYPLAGRLTLKESGTVDLQCNDAGAIFVETSVNFELSQLEGPGPMPMLSGMDVMNNVAQMAPGLHYIPDQINPEIPVLVIQATRFTCGSVAVAVNWHHTVADGFSGCHFVRSWAAIATGQALDLQPSFDRHLLQPRSPTDVSRITNGNYGSSPTCDQTSDIPPRQQGAVAVTPPIIKPFALKKETVQRLKDGLNNHIEAGSNTISVSKPFTSVESISAELWKLITKARSLIHDEEARSARSRFFMFVDGRKRLGLPPGYFGNVVCSACAETTQDELLKRPLSYAASLIQTATKGIDSEYFRSLIDWVEEREKGSSKGCESEHLNSRGNDVAATFWTSFPLYEINFGWGKPIMSFRNAPPRKLIDGIAMMPDPKGSGNMVALLNMHKDRMERLEQDPDFRKTVYEVAALPKSTRS